MNKSVVGNRSNLILTNCYNIETKEWEFIEIDLREPMGKYIPEYIFDELWNIGGTNIPYEDFKIALEKVYGKEV